MEKIVKIFEIHRTYCQTNKIKIKNLMNCFGDFLIRILKKIKTIQSNFNDMIINYLFTFYLFH